MTDTDEFFKDPVQSGPILPQELPQLLTDLRKQIPESNTQMSNRKITVHYSRTKQVSQYEPAHASVTEEFEVAEGTPQEDVDKMIQDSFLGVKGAALEQLGLSYTYEQHENRIMETFPGGTTVASAPVNPAAGTTFTAPPPVAAPAPMAQAPAPAAPAGVRRTKPPVPADYPKWDMIVQELQAGSAQSFYDNRVDKKNPRGPDFKIKETSAFYAQNGLTRDTDAVWLNQCPDQHLAFFGVTA